MILVIIALDFWSIITKLKDFEPSDSLVTNDFASPAVLSDNYSISHTIYNKCCFLSLLCDILKKM